LFTKNQNFIFVNLNFFHKLLKNIKKLCLFWTYFMVPVPKTQLFTNQNVYISMSIPDFLLTVLKQCPRRNADSHGSGSDKLAHSPMIASTIVGGAPIDAAHATKFGWLSLPSTICG